jgi:hypothetical protein
MAGSKPCGTTRASSHIADWLGKPLVPPNLHFMRNASTPCIHEYATLTPRWGCGMAASTSGAVPQGIHSNS